MADGDRGCGPVYALYAAARRGEAAAVEAVWADAEVELRGLDPGLAEALDLAVSAGDLEAVAEAAAEAAFVGAERPTLDGPVARAFGALLFGFGYLASVVLFVRARTPAQVVARLRWAYRTVGVDVRAVESTGGVERTVFRCPYRGLGADRFGERRVCHDVLDRVDDGYVAFLAHHRGLDYDRPRACAASDCCYSEVSTP
jgi:hypothetical protein